MSSSSTIGNGRMNRSADLEPIGSGPVGFSGGGCRLRRLDDNTRRCALPLEPADAVLQCDQRHQGHQGSGTQDGQQEASYSGNMGSVSHLLPAPNIISARRINRVPWLINPRSAPSAASAALKSNAIARPASAAGPVRWRNAKTFA